MSIRTNPMKAVPVLLKRVSTARSKFMEKGRDESFDGKLDKLTRVLNKIEDVFMRVKENQDALLDALHEVDSHLRKLDRTRLDQDMDAICRRIRDCAYRLLPMDTFESDSCDEKSSEIVHSSNDPSSSQYNNNHLQLPQPQHENLNLERVGDMLEDGLGHCLYSLSIFPEGAVLKKRHTIYLWIGLGLIANTEEKTAEEVGEDVVHQLVELNLIVPYGNGKCPLVNKFQIHPQFRPHLESILSKYRKNVHHLGYYFARPSSLYSWLILEPEKGILPLGARFETEDWTRSVFNLGANYLNFEFGWFKARKYLQVLQLGRWQHSASYHIEVGSQEFLEELRHHKYLRYLSLRGISRISELPPSIAQIETLVILDLKSCHNLETLPNDVSSMKHLTHLILSKCYLLDAVPKGIDKLTHLQVLKGFVIGSSRKTPCRISDLANLKKLRRLSIHIERDAVIKDMEFESLREMSGLEHLKISWGVSDTRYSDIGIILPLSLKKLHLEGFPGQVIPEWLKPSRLPWGFKELKLIGGKLESLNHDDYMRSYWVMEIVRLKYLKHLKVDLGSLREFFPMLRYIEIRQISNHSYIERTIHPNLAYKTMLPPNVRYVRMQSL